MRPVGGGGRGQVGVHRSVDPEQSSSGVGVGRARRVSLIFITIQKNAHVLDESPVDGSTEYPTRSGTVLRTGRLLSVLLQGGVFKVPGSCLVCWSTEKEDLADSDRVAAVAD